MHLHKPHLPHLDPHKLYHRAQHAAHLTYFGLVFLEGHSGYSIAAGYLFISTAVGLFLHEGEI